MSPAHVCLRSVLTQAFRPSNLGVAAPYSVASFLVPVISRPAKRTFSASRHAGKDHVPPSSSSNVVQDIPLLNYPQKPTNKRPASCIKFPPREARGDVDQWLTAIDPFLPGPLRRSPSDQPDQLTTVTSTDLSLFLLAAQASGLDILSHIGLTEGRWATVVWLAKKLVEDGRRSIDPPVQLEPSINVHWPEIESRSLDDLTDTPLRLERVRTAQKVKLSLKNMTAAPDRLHHRHAVTKRALGQLWRSLGNMILQSTERTDDKDDVMPYVLEIIAHLHHVGFIPDAVYTYRPHENQYALQQPPTLHMLSSQILTTLSDATWKAHEASVRREKKDAKASYFLGHEIPGSRYRSIVHGVAPELWLELVLWSSLHGGWIQDGVVILEQMAQKRGEQSWGLISWRELMQAEQQNAPAPSRLWNLFPMREELTATAQDRAKTRRTISSEVVTAFIDANIGEIRVAVGRRGVQPEMLLGQIKTLKGFLDANNLSLGSASWDSIMVRLLESGGLDPMKYPQILLRLFELAAKFGVEVSSANTSATTSTDVPYFFEPTALPLNLLHQAIRVFYKNGDLTGAMTAFKLLQQYTDENKQRSLQEFFEMLKAATPRKGQPFSSDLPPVKYPAFDINLPIHLRARLLDLATETKEFELGRWFLFTQDIDGPLISRDLYDNRQIAASIVRFGTMAGENDLVMEIIGRMGVWDEEQQQQRMPAQILLTLLCSQIQMRRWTAVQNMQQYIVGTNALSPRPVIFSTFAAELLRTSRERRDQLVHAQQAFTDLLIAWEKSLLLDVQNELYCIIAIMSTVSTDWKRYCSQFLALSFRQEVNLSTWDFNTVLAGVLDAYGSSAGQRIVDTWCYRSQHHFEPYRAPGGLSTMPRYWAGKAVQYRGRPSDIELSQESGSKQTLQGRVQPNRQTILSILRRLRLELDQNPQDTDRGQTRNMVNWTVRMLRKMGYNYGDIKSDLGDQLVSLAKLEAAVPGDNFGADLAP